MRLSRITWPKAEEYFKENDMAMIPIGSVECHGRHLPLGTDVLIPERIADLVEKKSDIMIAPMIPFGACQSLAQFPGTINIDPEILYQYVKQVVDSLYRHGARKFVFLNGHGGNVNPITRIGLEYDEKGAMTVLLNWWLMAWDMNPAWKGGHGGGEETAAIMAIDPTLVDRSEIDGPMKLKDINENIAATGFYSFRYKGVEINVPRGTRNITDNGWIGNDHPETATVEWGTEMIRTTADYIAELIEELKSVKI